MNVPRENRDWFWNGTFTGKTLILVVLLSFLSGIMSSRSQRNKQSTNSVPKPKPQAKKSKPSRPVPEVILDNSKCPICAIEGFKTSNNTQKIDNVIVISSLCSSCNGVVSVKSITLPPSAGSHDNEADAFGDNREDDGVVEVPKGDNKDNKSEKRLASETEEDSQRPLLPLKKAKVSEEEVVVLTEKQRAEKEWSSMSVSVPLPLSEV